MLEQFRILRAALKLGEFTTRQLAEESGVLEGTVQRTLRRRADLFIKLEAKAAGRSNRRAWAYRVHTDTTLAALQTALDEAGAPAMPEAPAGSSFGLELARDTLIRVLPHAESHDRWRLLKAATYHLALDQADATLPSYVVLASLHDHLSTLVHYAADLSSTPALDSWEVGLNHEGPRPSVVIGGVIESLLSSRQRAERDVTPNLKVSALASLVSLPWFIARHERENHKSRFGLLPINWPQRVLSAAWAVTCHELWTEVAGDLASNVNFSTAVTAAAADVGRPTKLAKIDPDLHSMYRGRDGGSGLPLVAFRNSFTPFEDGPDPGAAPAISMRVNISAQSTKVEGSPQTSSEAWGYLSRVDLDLSAARVVGMSVDYPREDQSVWVAFEQLATTSDILAYDARLGFNVQEHNNRGHFEFGAKTGVCFWRKPGRLQLRLDPSSTIDIVGAETDLSPSLLGHSDRRIGEVLWFDIISASGKIESANVSLGHRTCFTVPAGDLEYDANKDCFILRHTFGGALGPDLSGYGATFNAPILWKNQGVQ